MATINKGKKKEKIYKRKKYLKLEHTELSSKVYNSKWNRLRKAYLMLHPLCEECLEKGIIKPAAEVHHIVPISTGNSFAEMCGLAYDPKNLKALCVECHHKIHLLMRGRKVPPKKV